MTSRNRESAPYPNTMQSLEARLRKKAKHFRDLENIEASNELHAAANSIRQAILLGEMLLDQRDEARSTIRHLRKELQETKRSMRQVIEKYDKRLADVHK